jgi:hypothetical protein
VDEDHDGLHLFRREIEGGHAFFGAAVADYGSDEGAVNVVGNEFGTGEVRTIFAPAGVTAVAKGAGLHELLLSGFYYVRIWRLREEGRGSQEKQPSKESHKFSSLLHQYYNEGSFCSIPAVDRLIDFLRREDYTEWAEAGNKRIP